MLFFSSCKYKDFLIQQTNTAKELIVIYFVSHTNPLFINTVSY